MSPENTEKLVHMGMEIKNRVMAVIKRGIPSSITASLILRLRESS
ncbi:hypothetical protein DSOL_3677 [Desulfosporosinus metallidurans]|uniref:Uncharacterized protein n=1 Tax=Desulfosporosinus metallidurans TaxID=1888891 RepID=A0A1Q8QPA9_9FIRM|nr:hypothetical protein DSOL_3677 [Desulfosporosinus metallidurans]